MESAVVETALEAINPRKKRINYALGAILVSKGASFADAASQCGAKNAKTLQVGLRKKGITAKDSRTLPRSELETKGEVGRMVVAVVDAMRDKVNEELLDQIEHVRAKKISYAQLASKGQGRAAVVKTIAESFKALNGAADQVNIIFGVNTLREADPSTIDVQATVEPSGE